VPKISRPRIRGPEGASHASPPALRRAPDGPGPAASAAAPGLGGLLFSGLLAGAGLLAAAAWMGGSLGSFGARMTDGLNAVMRSAGFSVERIAIVGLEPMLERRALEASGVSAGQSMLAADPGEIRARIEELDAVGAASVQRLWPDQITIIAQTREPVALWKDSGAWRVVDVSGRPFQEAKAEQHADLPRIRGEGAAEAVGGLLAALEAFPALQARFEAADRVGMRRWSIVLKGGAELALPEDERLPEALEAINLLHAQSRVLDLPLARLDARHPDRIALRPSVPEPPAQIAPGDA